jgi:hypothetical protein
MLDQTKIDDFKANLRGSLYNPAMKLMQSMQSLQWNDS